VRYLKKIVKLTIATILLLLALATFAKPAQSDSVIPGTTIAIDPAVITGLLPGDIFKVNVTISGVPANNLSMWVLTLKWDSTVLNLTEIIEGPYLKQVGTTVFTWGEWNNDVGYVEGLTCATMDLTPSPQTSGILVTFTFNTTAAGTSSIDLTSPEGAKSWTDKPIWVDAGGREYTFETAIDGSVTVVSEFPAFLIAPIFIAITLLTIVIIRKTWKPKSNEHPNMQ
jgi:hypothetical protein